MLLRVGEFFEFSIKMCTIKIPEWSSYCGIFAKLLCNFCEQPFFLWIICEVLWEAEASENVYCGNFVKLLWTDFKRGRCFVDLLWKFCEVSGQSLTFVKVLWKFCEELSKKAALLWVICGSFVKWGGGA